MNEQFGSFYRQQPPKDDPMKKDLGTYSVLYTSSDRFESGENAVDWEWEKKGEWGRSDTDGYTRHWYRTEGLNKEAYAALLDHFGLTDWASEFPIERVIAMSPGQLAAERRKKEAEHHLPKLEMMNACLGNDYNRPAEDWD